MILHSLSSWRCTVFNLHWFFLTPKLRKSSSYSKILRIFQVSSIANNDGEVTKEEFLNYARHSEFFKTQMDKTDSDSMAHKQEAIAKAERAFKLFDKDNDGYLSCFQNKFHKERNIPTDSKSAIKNKRILVSLCRLQKQGTIRASVWWAQHCK